VSYTLMPVPRQNPGLPAETIRTLYAMWDAARVDERGHGHLTAAAWVQLGTELERAEILTFHLAYRDDDPAGMVAAVAVETVELPP